MKSFESERFEAIMFTQTIQEVRLLGMGKEFRIKVTKGNKGWRECSQTLMSLSPSFSFSNFFSTEFLILPISCGSDNVKLNSIKTHLRGFPYVCYSYITRSKAKFCQRGLLVHVYLCVKVNTKIYNISKAKEEMLRPLLQQQYEHTGPSKS